MAELHGLGYLPDIPKIEDYDEHNPNVAKLLNKTKLAHRVTATVRAMGIATGQAVAAAPAASPQVDLRPWVSPIEAQRQLGSCPANAAVDLLEHFERMAKGKYIHTSRPFRDKAE